MPEHSTRVRDIAGLAVTRIGRVEETGDPLLPFRLLDEHDTEVPAVTEFLHNMLADDASPASLRSYAFELLAWFRFLKAVDVPWHLAGRAEARDFALWLKTTKKPERIRRRPMRRLQARSTLSPARRRSARTTPRAPAGTPAR